MVALSTFRTKTWQEMSNSYSKAKSAPQVLSRSILDIDDRRCRFLFLEKNRCILFQKAHTSILNKENMAVLNFFEDRRSTKYEHTTFADSGRITIQTVHAGL
jgi:hypothetical protein